MTVNYVTGEITEAPLTAMERSTLTHAEAKIERGLASFVEVGEALAEVRDARLYRETHATFLDYCRDRWGISDSRARQLIGAAETVTTVTTLGAPAPSNEGQARALSGLGADAAAEVMRRAHDATGGNVTAAAIRWARTPQTPAPKEGEAGGAGPHVSADPADEPEGEGAPENVKLGSEHSAPGVATPDAPRPPVTGIDGKTYSRPEPKPAPAPVAPDDEFTDQDRAEELASNLASILSLLYAVTNPERRAEYIANWRLGTRARPVLGAQFVTPTHMRTLAEALRSFASEWENAHA